jgi:hypothetical protein
MDLYENPDKNIMTATFELPGLTKDNVHIDVQNGNLAVSGENTQSSEQHGKGYAIKERKFGRFVRNLKLPDGTKVCNELPFAYESFRFGAGSDRFSVSAVQGRQGVVGERRFDRHLSQVFS